MITLYADRQYIIQKAKYQLYQREDYGLVDKNARQKREEDDKRIYQLWNIPQNTKSHSILFCPRSTQFSAQDFYLTPGSRMLGSSGGEGESSRVKAWHAIYHFISWMRGGGGGNRRLFERHRLRHCRPSFPIAAHSTVNTQKWISYARKFIFSYIIVKEWDEEMAKQILFHQILFIDFTNEWSRGVWYRFAKGVYIVYSQVDDL